MVPVLPPGTLIIGLRWFHGLMRNDVVVLTYGDKEIVKRIDSIQGDELFVIGDHAETSTDSRHFGTVAKASVVARVIYPRIHMPDLRG